MSVAAPDEWMDGWMQSCDVLVAQTDLGALGESQAFELATKVAQGVESLSDHLSGGSSE